MAIDLSMKKVPNAVKIIIAVIPSVILIVLFIFLIYNPKQKEITTLDKRIVKLDSDINNGKVMLRKLDELKAENKRLKAKLAKQQEQLPEEKEVSILLKQLSDLGVKSGLEILLWKPEKRNGFKSRTKDRNPMEKNPKPSNRSRHRIRNPNRRTL